MNPTHASNFSHGNWPWEESMLCHAHGREHCGLCMPEFNGSIDRSVPKPIPDMFGALNNNNTVEVRLLPGTPSERKAVPLARGVFDYFPAALIEIAKVSKAGNDKHNPGEEMHHARGKSMDHADSIARHLLERGTIDPEDGLSHTAHLAWRALALLQEECEQRGAPKARGAR